MMMVDDWVMFLVRSSQMFDGCGCGCGCLILFDHELSFLEDAATKHQDANFGFEDAILWDVGVNGVAQDGVDFPW